MKVALYARVSKANCHQDPELQLRDLRRWAELSGHEVFQEYVDHGVSGSQASRPAKDELMRHANHGRFQAVVVWKLDRFARSVRHLVNDVAQLDDWEVSFISIRDNLDFSTAAGKLMFHVIAAMAEFERELTRAGPRRNCQREGEGPARRATDLGDWPLAHDAVAEVEDWQCMTRYE